MPTAATVVLTDAQVLSIDTGDADKEDAKELYLDTACDEIDALRACTLLVFTVYAGIVLFTVLAPTIVNETKNNANIMIRLVSNGFLELFYNATCIFIPTTETLIHRSRCHSVIGSINNLPKYHAIGQFDTVVVYWAIDQIKYSQ